jgi:integrase
MSNKKIGLYKDDRPIRKKRYIARWEGVCDITGKKKRYSRSFARKKDAEAFIAQKESDFNAGMPRDERKITLCELCNKFIKSRENRLRHSTIRGYKETIEQLENYFGSGKLINNVRLEDAESFVANLKLASPSHLEKGKKLSDSSRNKHLRQAKSIFTSAVDWNYIRISPFAKIKQVRPQTDPWHFITQDEFRAIINKTPDLRTKALYYTCYYCGLRSGEALNLLSAGVNVDFESGKINIVNRRGSADLPPFSVKDYEARSIGMPKQVQQILHRLHQEAEEGCPFVFLTKERWQAVKSNWDKKRQSGKATEWVNKMLFWNALRNFKKYCRDAGIKTNEKLTLHCLRKSWACNLASCGTAIQTLLKLGGWSDAKTVQHYYLKSSDENEKKAVRDLEKLAEKKDNVEISLNQEI